MKKEKTSQKHDDLQKQLDLWAKYLKENKIQDAYRSEGYYAL